MNAVYLAKAEVIEYILTIIQLLLHKFWH
jgi:hypothetical protein